MSGLPLAVPGRAGTWTAQPHPETLTGLTLAPWPDAGPAPTITCVPDGVAHTARGEHAGIETVLDDLAGTLIATFTLRDLRARARVRWNTVELRRDVVEVEEGIGTMSAQQRRHRLRDELIRGPGAPWRRVGPLVDEHHVWRALLTQLCADLGRDTPHTADVDTAVSALEAVRADLLWPVVALGTRAMPHLPLRDPFGERDVFVVGGAVRPAGRGLTLDAGVLPELPMAPGSRAGPARETVELAQDVLHLSTVRARRHVTQRLDLLYDGPAHHVDIGGGVATLRSAARPGGLARTAAPPEPLTDETVPLRLLLRALDDSTDGWLALRGAAGETTTPDDLVDRLRAARDALETR